MRRRLAILLSVVLVLVAVAVPCMAADFDYVDFIENYNTDGTVVDVSIPASAFTNIQWKLYNSGLSTIGTSWGINSTFNLTANTSYGLGVFPFSEDFLVLDDIPSGTSLDLWLDYYSTGNYTPVIQGRINFDFFDSSGAPISSYQSSWVDITSSRVLSGSIDKPSGAKYVRISGIYRNFIATDTGSFSVTFQKAVLHLDINAMYVQQVQTGRTNKLLQNIQQNFDDFINREPDPVEPTWGEAAGDAEQNEDQIIDQLDPDKVTNELADMHLTLVDNLLLYTNAFAAISAIWVVLIDLPFIKIILYCSLLFGLLAAFLGMGLAAGRASDRHSGRSSGKKGK